MFDPCLVSVAAGRQQLASDPLVINTTMKSVLSKILIYQPAAVTTEVISDEASLQYFLILSIRISDKNKMNTTLSHQQ